MVKGWGGFVGGSGFKSQWEQKIYLSKINDLFGGESLIMQESYLCIALLDEQGSCSYFYPEMQI